MDTICLILLGVIIFLIGFLVLILRIGQNNYKRQDDQQETMKEILESQILKLKAENELLKDYRKIFCTYYNDDWNRDTPFRDHIDFIYTNYILQNKDKLETIVKDIKIRYPKEKVLTEMKTLFGKENTEVLQNIPLFHLIFFSASLKTYRENGTGDWNDTEKPLTPEQFLEKSIGWYKRYVK
ncbi:MAG: hypothetical protein Q3983_07535 [Capnocytophaga sp.]|nr:hypothetical protein [Capnocytophaga sp.]